MTPTRQLVVPMGVADQFDDSLNALIGAVARALFTARATRRQVLAAAARFGLTSLMPSSLIQESVRRFVPGFDVPFEPVDPDMRRLLEMMAPLAKKLGLGSSPHRWLSEIHGINSQRRPQVGRLAQGQEVVAEAARQAYGIELLKQAIDHGVVNEILRRYRRRERRLAVADPTGEIYRLLKQEATQWLGAQPVTRQAVQRFVKIAHSSGFQQALVDQFRQLQPKPEALAEQPTSRAQGNEALDREIRPVTAEQTVADHEALVPYPLATQAQAFQAAFDAAKQADASRPRAIVPLPLESLAGQLESVVIEAHAVSRESAAALVRGYEAGRLNAQRDPAVRLASRLGIDATQIATLITSSVEQASQRLLHEDRVLHPDASDGGSGGTHFTTWTMPTRGLVIKEPTSDAALASAQLARERLGGLVAGFVIIERDGRSWIVQEPASPMPQVITRLLRAGAIEEASGLVRRAIELNMETLRRGVWNRDLPLENYGVTTDGRVVLIDLGSFRPLGQLLERPRADEREAALRYLADFLIVPSGLSDISAFLWSKREDWQREFGFGSAKETEKTVTRLTARSASVPVRFVPAPIRAEVEQVLYARLTETIGHAPLSLELDMDDGRRILTGWIEHANDEARFTNDERRTTSDEPGRVVAFLDGSLIDRLNTLPHALQPGRVSIPIRGTTREGILQELKTAFHPLASRPQAWDVDAQARALWDGRIEPVWGTTLTIAHLLPLLRLQQSLRTEAPDADANLAISRRYSTLWVSALINAARRSGRFGHLDFAVMRRILLERPDASDPNAPADSEIAEDYIRQLATRQQQGDAGGSLAFGELLDFLVYCYQALAPVLLTAYRVDRHFRSDPSNVYTSRLSAFGSLDIPSEFPAFRQAHKDVVLTEIHRFYRILRYAGTIRSYLDQQNAAEAISLLTDWEQNSGEPVYAKLVRDDVSALAARGDATARTMLEALPPLESSDGRDRLRFFDVESLLHANLPAMSGEVDGGKRAINQTQGHSGHATVELLLAMTGIGSVWLIAGAAWSSIHRIVPRITRWVGVLLAAASLWIAAPSRIAAQPITWVRSVSPHVSMHVQQGLNGRPITAHVVRINRADTISVEPVPATHRSGVAHPLEIAREYQQDLIQRYGEQRAPRVIAVINGAFYIRGRGITLGRMKSDGRWFIGNTLRFPRSVLLFPGRSARELADALDPSEVNTVEARDLMWGVPGLLTAGPMLYPAITAKEEGFTAERGSDVRFSPRRSVIVKTRQGELLFVTLEHARRGLGFWDMRGLIRQLLDGEPEWAVNLDGGPSSGIWMLRDDGLWEGQEQGSVSSAIVVLAHRDRVARAEDPAVVAQRKAIAKVERTIREARRELRDLESRPGVLRPRIDAAHRLASIGSDRAISELLALQTSLEHGQPEIGRALRELPSGRVERLVRRWLARLRQQLFDADAPQRQRAVLALGKLGRRDTVPDLIDRLDRDPDGAVRLVAAQALVQLNTPQGWRAIRWHSIVFSPRWRDALVANRIAAELIGRARPFGSLWYVVAVALNCLMMIFPLAVAVWCIRHWRDGVHDMKFIGRGLAWRWRHARRFQELRGRGGVRILQRRDAVRPRLPILGLSLRLMAEARERLQPFVTRTPLIALPRTSEAIGRRVWIKDEGQQGDAGSFKPRMFAALIERLQADPTAIHTIVSATTGNQGIALAEIVKKLRDSNERFKNLRAVIFVSTDTPEHKVQRMIDLGADVRRIDGRYPQATDEAKREAEQAGHLFIEHAGREAIISYGSLMLELLDDLVDRWKATKLIPEDFDAAAWVGEMVAIETRVAAGELSRDVADTQRDVLRAQLPLLGTAAFLVPVGAGGLSSGVFAAAKMLHPDATVIGVMTERTASMYESVKAARIRPARDAEEVYSEDGIKVGAVEQMALDVHDRLADAEVIVPHDRIRDGMCAHRDEAGIMSEGASVLPYLALQLPAIQAQLRARGVQDVVLISTGSNIEPERWRGMMDERPAARFGWLRNLGSRALPLFFGTVGALLTRPVLLLLGGALGVLSRSWPAAVAALVATLTGPSADAELPPGQRDRVERRIRAARLVHGAS